MVHSSIEYYRKHHKMMQVVELEDAVNESIGQSIWHTANLEAKDLLIANTATCARL